MNLQAAAEIPGYITKIYFRTATFPDFIFVLIYMCSIYMHAVTPGVGLSDM